MLLYQCVLVHDQRYYHNRKLKSQVTCQLDVVMLRLLPQRNRTPRNIKRKMVAIGTPGFLRLSVMALTVFEKCLVGLTISCPFDTNSESSVKRTNITNSESSECLVAFDTLCALCSYQMLLETALLSTRHKQNSESSYVCAFDNHSESYECLVAFDTNAESSCQKQQKEFTNDEASYGQTHKKLSKATKRVHQRRSVLWSNQQKKSKTRCM